MSSARSFLYAHARDAVLKDSRRAWRFALAACLHGLGQGAAAAVAGVLCRALVVSNGAAALRIPHFPIFSVSPLGWAGLALGALVVKVGAGIVAAYEEARLAGEVCVDLRGAVLDTWLGAEPTRRAGHADHGAQNPTETKGVLALTDRVRDVEVGLSKGLLGSARAALQLVPLAVVLVVLAPKLALTAIAVLAVFSVFLGVGRAAFKREQKRLTEKHEALSAAADEAIRHADLWKTYGAEKKIRAHVANVGARIAEHAARLEARGAAWSGANEILGASALVLALVAARSGLVGEGTAASLLPFSVAFFLAYRPLRELAEARLAWTRALVAAEEMAPRSPSAIASTAISATTVDEPKKDWPLERLDLRALVLAHGTPAPLTLAIEKGAIVAVTGANGAGKTTLFRTLLGLEHQRGGSIFYGATKLDHAKPGPHARPFAWVPQEAPLLADTLHANVALAEKADENVLAALAQMGLEDLARDLADARIGAAGRPVSGGERRAIAIARALATNLPVLLLDEPTAGLDERARVRLAKAILSLARSRTVIVITHHDELVWIADRVVSLDASANVAELVA